MLGLQVPIDIRTGITDQQAAHIVDGLKVRACRHEERKAQRRGIVLLRVNG